MSDNQKSDRLYRCWIKLNGEITTHCVNAPDKPTAGHKLKLDFPTAEIGWVQYAGPAREVTGRDDAGDADDFSREEWLSRLQPGDEIICAGRFNYTVETIQKITPTGRITLTNGEKYDKHGRQSRGDWSSYKLEPYTYDRMLELKKKSLISEIEQFNGLQNCTIDQLERILAIRKEETEPQQS